MPSLAELEQWMEEQLPPNLHDLPHKVHATLQAYSEQIYAQLSDLTPSLSQIEDSIRDIPTLVGNAASSSQQLFQQQTPPPPPRVPTFMERIGERADAITGSRQRTNIIAGVALVGISAAVVRQTVWPSATRRRRHALRTAKTINGTRREIIVVLGGDTPIGQALCHQLSTQGFIVIASVSNEQSMQNFDSLIPPSSRGFIKSLLLDPFGPQPQDIAAFVSAVSSSRELRWPLTSAGDPYARPGDEAQVVGLINTLSYRSASETVPGPVIDTLASSLQIDRLTDEMQRRVITPLATISALVPLLHQVGKQTDEIEELSPAVIVSLVNDGGETDSYSTALKGGMRRIQLHQAQASDTFRRRATSAASLAGSSSSSGKRRRLLVTTLEAKSSSLRTLFASLLPSSIGGGAPTLNTSVAGISASRRLAMRPESESRPTRPTYMQRSPSMSASKAQKEVEFKRVLEAATAILLSPLATKALRPIYTVRLPAVANTAATAAASTADGSSCEHRRLESTLLLQVLRTASTPFVIVARSLGRWLSIYPLSWCSSSSVNARGTAARRSWYNPRPAYGPGPGPASNTHSRTSIRRAEEAHRPSTGLTGAAASQEQSRRRQRPTSAASTSSSEAKSSEAAPPSNNGMSSSGIFSSVPSSAFGDGEGMPDLDSEDGNGSPFEAESPPMRSHDSGAHRHRQQQQQESDSTPSASRLQQSLRSSAPSSTRGTTPPGADSPLGQSWVALGESQSSQGGESSNSHGSA